MILGGCEVYIGGESTRSFLWIVSMSGVLKISFQRHYKVVRYWTNWGYCGSESFTEEQWAFEIFPDGVIKYYAYPEQKVQ